MLMAEGTCGLGAAGDVWPFLADSVHVVLKGLGVRLLFRVWGRGRCPAFAKNW